MFLVLIEGRDEWKNWGNTGDSESRSGWLGTILVRNVERERGVCACEFTRVCKCFLKGGEMDSG